MNPKSLFPLSLALLLLSGCTQPAPESTPSAPPAESAPAQVLTPCRIVDGAATGELLLAAREGSEIYTLSAQDLTVTVDGVPSAADALQDGMTVSIGHTGDVLETWPARFAAPQTIAADSAPDDRCGLYLQVLEDLWEKDPAMNEGLTYLGVDLSQVTDLTDSEKHAVAWRFAQTHDLTLLELTANQLVEEGYLTQLHPADGSPYTAWLDGILFTIVSDEDAAWSLPDLGPGEEPPVLNAFDANKWRGPLAAYSFNGCCGRMGEDGAWTYCVMTETIA